MIQVVGVHGVKDCVLVLDDRLLLRQCKHVGRPSAVLGGGTLGAVYGIIVLVELVKHMN